MLIVYRKDNNEIVFNSGKSFVTPEGMTDENGKLAVMEKVGGSFDDYGVYRLHDINDSEKVEEILAYEKYTYLVFEDNIPIGYEIDYEAYENDKALEKEMVLKQNLVPSQIEVFLAESEMKTIKLLEEVGLL